MRSKTSFFNAALWRKTICRFWPLWVIYLGVWFFALLLPLGSSLRWWVVSTDVNAALQVKNYILSAGLYGGVFISLFGGLAIAMAMFGYLYNSRHAGMMAALPIRREGQFLSQYLAGLFMLLAMDVVIALLALAVQGFYGVAQLEPTLQWLGQIALLNLFFYSFAVLVSQLTGNLIILPLVYGVLNVVVTAFELLFRYLISTFVYGMNSAIGLGSESLRWFSPLVKLLSNCTVEQEYEYIYDSMGMVSRQNLLDIRLEGWLYLIVYGLVGLAFAVGALLLYRRRRMEAAGDVVAWRGLKPVFLVCMAIGCGLCLGALFLTIARSQSLGLLLLFVVLGCFVGWFAGAMLVKKRFRVFSGRSFLGFAIVAACMGGLFLAWEYDVFGYERHIPEPANVEYAKVYLNGVSMNLEDDRSLELLQALHQACLDERTLGGRQDYDGPYDGESLDVQLEYMLRDGGRVVRSYSFWNMDEEITFTEDRLGGRASALVNCDEAILERKVLSGPVEVGTISYATIEYWDPILDQYTALELGAEEALELYETCLQPETASGVLARVWLFGGEEYEAKVCNATVYLELRYPRPEETDDGPRYWYEGLDYTVNLDAAATCAWLESKDVPITTVRDKIRYYEQMEENGEIGSPLREELGIPASVALPASGSDIAYVD